MDETIRRLCGRYLQRLASQKMAEVDPTAKEVPANRLVDLILFTMAFDAYSTWMEQQDRDTDATLSRGAHFVKRYLPILQTAIQQHVLPLGDRTDAAILNTALRLSQRTGSPSVAARYQATMFKSLFQWLRSRQMVFRDLFPGLAAKAAREAMSISQEESPAALLNKVANIAPVSGLTLLRKWIQEAAEAAGVPVTPTEAVMVDAQIARKLGEELQGVSSHLTATDAGSPQAAELQEQRTHILTQIQKVADQSTDPSTVLATAASAQQTTMYATATGKRLGHTPDQEVAMMVRGRSIIAAGAGSGKTRVLASKVAYHINELGVDPSSILATTFTTKAAAELVKRVKAYGAVIEGSATDGFGTTHSIAGKLLNRRATSFRKQDYISKKEGWKQSTLLRLATEQVKMPGGGELMAPPAKGFWEGAFVPERAQDLLIDPAYQGAIDDAIGFFQWAARSWGNPWKDRPGNPKAAQWAAEQVPLLQDMRKLDPKTLTVSQKQYLNKLFEKTRRINYRVAAEEENSKPPEPKTKRRKLDDYQYYKAPARQWFNLGRKLTRETKEGQEMAVPLGEFKNAISIMKGKGISPSEAWHKGVGKYQAGSDEAAVYAAYEWLKSTRGEPGFAGTGDMDDILIDTVTALVGSPTLRRQMSAQYKVILLDEAQDLNRVQHLLFGLMAGYLDPSTLTPWPDKRMSADTLCLIGDDKQAIYAFRGADPDEFIDKSDLTEGGDDFTTKLLDINFRSGKDIVDAAGRLISHNKKQVPMTCKANVDRNGSGKILSRRVEDTEEAAKSVAEEIHGMQTSALPGATSWKDFGVAVRSNAEAFAYGVEMLKLGIPFRSNAQFFNDPNTKALIGWLTIAEHGLDGPEDIMEDAVRSAVRAPFAKLGRAFFTSLEEKATGSWPAWLVDHYKEIYAHGQWQEILGHFVENLQTVVTFKGDPPEVMNQIFELKGIDGNSVQEAMFEAVEDDDDLMSELAAAAEGGRVSREQIEEAAMAPVQPLVGLMKGKADLTGAMTFVRKLQRVNAKIASADTEEEIDRDAVTIGTMHSWKGLEVPNMYVPMVGGKFPRAGVAGVASEGPDLWSERRLAYVAITRAEQRCVLLDIPNPKTGLSSQFIDETCIPIEGADQSTGQVPKVSMGPRITPAMIRRASQISVPDLWGEDAP